MRLQWFHIGIREYSPTNEAASAGLPAWPVWTVRNDGQSCIVSGRHLTPVRARIAHYLAVWSTLALLVLPGWYCWHFENIPVAVWQAIAFGGAKLGYYFMTYTARKWVIVALYLGCWCALPLWQSLFFYSYCRLLTKRTSVRFTAQHVIPRRFGRKYDRGVKITFLSQPHPKLPWLQLKAQRKGSNSLSVFYQQIRVLFMEYGHTMIPVAYFAVPDDAERFAAVCRFANAYQLKHPPATPVSAQTLTEVANAPDI